METTRIIEEYLDHTLSMEEHDAVEARLASDKDFSDLIALHKEVNESIGDKEFIELHRLIEKVSAEYLRRNRKQEAVTNPILFKKYFLRIAAILIIMVASGIIIKTLFFDHVNTEKLFGKYYATYDADVISRSAPSGTTTLDQAVLSYTNGEYNEALKLLDALVQQDEKNYLAWFYKGLSCLETDQTGEAVRSFRTIPDLWDSPYIEHRNWYLALALLRQGEITGASRAFRDISSANGYYARKAEKLYLKLSD